MSDPNDRPTTPEAGVIADDTELSDESLENVAGGVFSGATLRACGCGSPCACTSDSVSASR